MMTKQIKFHSTILLPVIFSFVVTLVLTAGPGFVQPSGADEEILATNVDSLDASSDGKKIDVKLNMKNAGGAQQRTATSTLETQTLPKNLGQVATMDGCPGMICSGDEDCVSCPSDCGVCSECTATVDCTDYALCTRCPLQCGTSCTPPVACNHNGVCEPGEYAGECPDDCGGGGGGGGGCFLAGTPITMGDGSIQPIENIKAGDTVLAYDEATKIMKPDKVKQVFVHAKEDTYLVINGHLKVTPIHRVLSKGNWVHVGDLKVGDTLTDTQGKDVAIENIAKVNGLVDVYNFEVNPYHTYIADGFVVHNRKDSDVVP